MLEALKHLVDSSLINEDTRQSIQEAWETQLIEAKERIAAELREEFAQKYEHDKGQLVESLDRMVTESLKKELEEFAHDKRQLAEERVALKKAVREHAGKLNGFVVKKLAEELKELNGDRAKVQENFAKLEQFIIKALSEEIAEFSQDKKEVVETKVRLIKEARTKFAELRSTFIKRSSEKVAEAVKTNLTGHMRQFKEDIEAARRNNFGRRLFEAFVTEYQSSIYNKKGEVARLVRMLDKKEQQVTEARAFASEKAKLVESKDAELRRIADKAERTKIVNELTVNLARDKKTVMLDLLEGVQTNQLRTSFAKYLPAVLNETQVKKGVKTLNEAKRETREVTGDKVVKTTPSTAEAEVIELRKLAGLS